MNIRPSAAIRQNYNEIAELCRKTQEPVFLTKNGEGDLVVMDIESFSRREKRGNSNPIKITSTIFVIINAFIRNDRI